MALTFISENNFPTYLAESSDIADNKIEGASIVPDLTLEDFVFPAPQA